MLLYGQFCFTNERNEISIKTLKDFDLSVFITPQKWRMVMDGNTLATIFAVLHIIWVLPLGYFSVMDILESDYFVPL